MLVGPRCRADGVLGIYSIIQNTQGKARKLHALSTSRMRMWSALLLWRISWTLQFPSKQVYLGKMQMWPLLRRRLGNQSPIHLFCVEPCWMDCKPIQFASSINPIIPKALPCALACMQPWVPTGLAIGIWRASGVAGFHKAWQIVKQGVEYLCRHPVQCLAPETYYVCRVADVPCVGEWKGQQHL